MLNRRLNGTGQTAFIAAFALLLLIAAITLLLHRPAEAQVNDKAVSNVSVTSPNPGELSISWDAPGDAPDDYRVTWKKSSGKWTSYEDDNTVDGGNAFPTGTSHTATGLEEGTEYSVRVRARYHDGNGNVEESGPWSTSVEITVAAQTPPPPPPSTPPAKPTGLSTGPSHDSVALSWTDPGDSSITSYQVLRGPDAANLAVLVDNTGSGSLSYTDSTVAAETTYAYAIKARNAHGLSPQSDAVPAITTAAPAPPAKPTGLSTSPSHNSVALSWADPSDSSITSYQILRGPDAASLAVLVDNTGSGSLSYTDSTVAAETTYAYAIKARNADGLSPQADAVSVTTPAAPVETPVPEQLPSASFTLDGQVLDTSGACDQDDIASVSDDCTISITTSSPVFAVRGTVDSDDRMTVRTGRDSAAVDAATATADQDDLRGTDRTATLTLAEGRHLLRLWADEDSTPGGSEEHFFRVNVLPYWELNGQELSRDSDCQSTSAPELAAITDSDCIVTQSGNTGSIRFHNVTTEQFNAYVSVNGSEVIREPDDTALGAPFTLALQSGDNLLRVRLASKGNTHKAESYGRNAFYYKVTTPSTPARPTGISYGASYNSALLLWTDPNDDTITGYQILRGEDADTLTVLENDTGSASASYTDDTVEPETEYFYSIRARNAGGLGPQSDTVSVTTQAAPEEPESALATATGQPKIRGSIQVGATLSIDTSDIEDTDGLTTSTFSYQWIRIDTDSTETNISTESTYTLTADDEGKTIKVKVSFTDEASNAEEVESDATRTVVARGAIRLLSNWGLSTQSRLPAQRVRQRFSTGDDPNGYTVRTVQFSFDQGSSTGRTFTAAVYQSAGGRNLGDLVFNLRPPERLSRGATNSLEAPPEAKLEPNTTYVLSMQGEESNLEYDVTSSRNEHSDTQPGWSISNEVYPDGDSHRLGALQMRLTGWVIADAPHITNVENILIPANNAGYNTGDIIKIGVTFNEAVDVTGTPTLELVIGSSTVDAQYQSAASNETDLVFTYTVVSGDLDRDGIQVNQDALVGTIKRKNAEVDADLLHNKLVLDYQTRVNSGVTIDEIAVTSRPIAPRHYGPGENINITVTFITPVTVTGDPEFEFLMANRGASGGNVRAQYDSGLSTGADVVFTYTVLSTDSDGDGIFLLSGENSLKLDTDDTIQGEDNKDSVLTYRELGTQGSHRVDQRPRTASVEVTSTPTAATDTYGAGEIIEFTLTFNQQLTVTGEPHYVFSLGNSGDTRDVTAVYDADRSSSKSLVFTYSVVSTDVDNNGIFLYAGDTSFVLESGETVRNEFGSDARTDYGGGGTQEDHKVNGGLALTNTGPTVIGKPKIGGSIQVGATLSVNTSDIGDTDGLTSPTFSYQWIRTDTRIRGATSSTYTLTTHDEGKTIKVQVSFNDDDNNAEEVESDATRTVAARTHITLVSNLRRAGLTAPYSGTLRQEFTTGDDSNGYLIREARIILNGSSRTTADRFEAAIYEKDGTNLGDLIITFSAPQTIRGNVDLQAPHGAMLEANMDYFLEIDYEREADIRVTPSGDEDSSTQPGWSIRGQVLRPGTSHIIGSMNMRLTGWVIADGPYITNVESLSLPANNAGYNTGDIIKIGVTFNEAVDVTGTPTLELVIGSSTVDAQYQSAESTDTDLVFTHTVASGDFDSDGIQVNQDSLDGTIKRKDAEVNADLLHHRLAPILGTRVNSGIPIDEIAVTSRPIAPRYYGPGENINITVTFAAPVTVTGDPEFEFSLGNAGVARNVRAQYNADLSTTTELVFTYTVLPTDEDSNGIFLRDGETSIKLDTDDSIQGADNKDAVLTYRELSTQSNHRIDRRPRVGSVSVTSTPTAGTDTYGAGEIIEFTMTFNQRVEVCCGASLYTFSLGNSGETQQVTAVYDAGRSSARSLVFTYTVFSSEVDNDGIFLLDSSESFMLITGESIRNIYGHDATIDFRSGGRQSEHKVDGSLTPANTPAMGLPTITGTYEVGGTLFSNRALITDAEGLTTPGWTYVWIRVGTDGTETDISGATSLVYTLVSGDEDLQLRVKITFTDDDGNSETRISAPYPPTQAPTAPETLALTTSNGTVTLDWTPPTDPGSSVIAKYQYRVSSDGGTTWSPDFTDVPDQDSDSDQADERSYTVSSLTLRTEHTFQVRAHNATRGGAAVSETITPANTLPEGLPTISGTAEVGQTLTVDTSDITDANGLTSPGWTYQWIRVDTDGTETDIREASSQTYTLTSADAGLQFRVRVTFTDDGGASETLRSDFYPTTKAPTAPDTLTLSNNRGDVTLSWTPPTDSGSGAIAKYQYRVSDDGGTTWSPDFTDVPDQNGDSDQADERSRTISGLTHGTEHTIEVRAHNATRGGAPASGTVTPATTPGRPRSVNATAGDQEVTVTWSPPSSDGGSPITHYQYRVRDETDNVWLPGFTNGFQTVPDGDADMDLSDELSITVTGLTNGHEYAFYVRAHNDQGGSGPPETTAIPTGPLQLTIDSVTGDGLINIQEKADGFAITGQAMMIENVEITVVIGASGNLTATTDSGGNWSVAVPANAAYIIEGTLTITVNATIVGYEAMEVTRQVIVDFVKPTILFGRVVADTITLNYSESLDETSVPDGSAYTVNVNGSSVPLVTTNPVTISDSVVTITLASAVSDTDTVTLDYTVPTGTGATPIKNLSGNLADALTNEDLSGVGVLVTDAADLRTNEDGTTDTFKVKLLSRPSANVSIALTSSDTDEGTVSPTPLTFTRINWDTDQTVTITGVDDTDEDDDQSYEITFAVTSTDTDYNGFTVSAVSVINIDDDESSDATLSGLTLADTDANAIDFNETFTSSLKTYTATAPVTAWRIVVTPTVNQEDATFEVLDGSGVALADADTDTADFDVDVPIGQSVVKVKVTAEDASTKETYTVTITRVDFLVSNLEGSTRSVVTIPLGSRTRGIQGFRTGSNADGYQITEVVIAVNQATDSSHQFSIRDRRNIFNFPGPGTKLVDLVGELSSAGEVSYHPDQPISLSANTRYVLEFRAPDKPIYLEDTLYRDESPGSAPRWTIVDRHDLFANDLSSAGGGADVPLKIAIKGRTPETDDTLSALTIADTSSVEIPLGTTFRQAITDYTVSAGTDTERVVLTAAKNQTAATIEYLDKDDAILGDADTNDADFDFDLSLGDNIVKVRVTAPNGVDQRVYTINVERKVDVTVSSDHERIVNKLHVPTFTLTRNGPLDQSIDVTVSLDNVGSGDAISSAPRTETATFAANSATAEYTPPAFWFRSGGSGEIIVSLVVPDTHTGDSVTVTALDVSTAVTVTIEQATYQVAEGAGDLSFNIKAVTIDDIPVPNQSFDVSFLTTQGTAKLTVDYTAVSRIVTIQPSSWTAESNHHVALKQLTVAIVDDSVYESRTDVNEHFLLQLQGTGELAAIIKIDAQALSGSRVEIIDDETLNITTTLAKAFMECTTSGLTVDQCAPENVITSAETGVADLTVDEDVARAIWLRVDTGTGTTGDPVTLDDNDKFQIVATPDTDHGAKENEDWLFRKSEIDADGKAVLFIVDDQDAEPNESVQFTVSLPGDTKVADSTATLRILDDERLTPPLLAELTIKSGGFDFTVERQTIDTYAATVVGTGTVTVSLIISTLDSSHTYELRDDANQIITDSDGGTQGDQISTQLGSNTIFIVVKDRSNQLARYTLNIEVKPAPSRLPAPTVSTSSDTRFALTATWTTPSSGTGGVIGYDLRYRTPADSGGWIELLTTDLATTRNLTGLIPDSEYEVQVRAKNNSAAAPWSPSATGRSSSADRRFNETPQIYVDRGARMDPSSDTTHRFKFLLPNNVAYRIKARGFTDKTIKLMRLDGTEIASYTGTGANHAWIQHTAPGRSMYYVEVTHADYLMVELATSDPNTFTPPRRDCVGTGQDYCPTPPRGKYERECKNLGRPNCIIDNGKTGFGSLYEDGDVDSWSVIFDLDATYLITVKGAGDQTVTNDNGGSLANPKLEILELANYDDATGFTWSVVATSTESGTNNKNIKYTFDVPTFTVQAPWLLRVSSADTPAGVGTYLISLHEVK